MAKIKVTGETKVKVKKKPIKAGGTHGKNTGGVLNAKMAAIVRKRRSRKNG